MKLIVAALLCLAISATPGQPAGDAKAKPTDMDFWVGEWDATWTEAEGVQAHGTNSITRTMNGKVIHEVFQIKTGQSAGFKGESWSVLDANTGAWRQTWVDTNGGYLALDHVMVDGNHGFQHTVKTANGKSVTQRMRFTEVKKESFVWIWEASRDGGKTWTESWKINYKRKK